jgi:prevent-host-death family protein
MATVGVRELQGDARRWLARVRAGEAVVITDRGRPVAKMIPLPEAVGFDALVAEGRIAPGPDVRWTRWTSRASWPMTRD